jgi:branched-chain amino acid transport system substrate-binding protein
MKISHCISISLIVCACFACTQKDIKESRAERARHNESDKILVGAAAPWKDIADKGLYWQGIEMAAEEVNAGGGVLDKKLKIIKADDNETVEQGRIIAQKFVDNPDIVAVIGHYNSYISIPTSIIYEYYGVLMLSPTSTNPQLTKRKGYNYIFRNIPTDEEIGRQLAKVSKENRLKHIVIYHVKDAYGLGLANAFEKKIEELGGGVVTRMSYVSTADRNYFRQDLKTLKKNYSFDAIFLAGVVPQAAVFIKTAREMGINVPIIGGDGLYSSQLWKIGGDATEGTIIGAYFDENATIKQVQRFKLNFYKKYGQIPDDWAAQGYDAVKLLVHAIKKAGTSSPPNLAEALRNTSDWQGVTGRHSFNNNGDVVDKPVILKTVVKKSFKLL